MSREEQIHNEAVAYEKMYETTESVAFTHGAVWADEHPKSPWIKCSERMPEVDKICLGYNSDGFAEIYTFNSKKKVFSDYDYYNDEEVYYKPESDIIAWMPIPKYEEE